MIHWALGSFYKNIGTFGHVGILSFNGNKIITFVNNSNNQIKF